MADPELDTGPEDPAPVAPDGPEGAEGAEGAEEAGAASEETVEERMLRAERAREAELQARLVLHEEDLLPLARESVAAARAGLASDVVDYAEVVRAALAEIELRLSRDELRWRLAASRVELAWLLGDARSVAHEEALR